MKVYVVSRPSLDFEAVEKFLREHSTAWRRTTDSSSGDELVELAGRVCYFSFGALQSKRTNREYISNLVSGGHDSVLEHAVWSFILTGVSRAFTHQLVRHRVGISFSQLSQQYYDEADAEFVPPPELEDHPKLQAIWRRSVQGSLDAYKQIVQGLELEQTNLPSDSASRAAHTEITRAVRSAARSVLPNATETKIFVTINGRALRHFLDVRGSIVGDLEMRLVSSMLLDAVLNDAPALFGDFYQEKLSDGTPIVKKRTAL
jgi:thymidylate synthase (FAD)